MNSKVYPIVCYLLFLMFMIFANKLVVFLPLSITLILHFLRAWPVLPLVCDQSLFCMSLIGFMPAFVVKLCLDGRIHGFILHSSLSAKDVVPPVSIVIYHSIFSLDISNMVALLACNLISLNVLIPFPIPLSGLPCSITDAILPLSPYYISFVQW